MDFRKLSYFEAVCRTMSFTKAAELLHVTQPSVTMAIRDLEKELGVQLLLRSRGSLNLTDDGAYILSKAQYLVHALEETERDVHSYLLQKRSNLRIGYSMQMTQCLRPLLAEFQAQSEGLHIIEQESPTPAILSRVRDGTLDLGILSASGAAVEDLTVFPLFPGELRVCTSKSNPLCACSAITLEEFQRQPLVALTLNNSQDSYIFQHLKDAYPHQKLDLRPQATYLMLDSYFQHLAQQGGVGLTYYDRWYSPNFSPDQACLTTLPFDPPCRYQVIAVSSSTHPKSPEIKLLAAFLQQKMTD